MDLQEVIRHLSAPRYRHDEIPPVSQLGVYAFHLTEPGALPIAAQGLLYVGMTEDGLDARNHFSQLRSGFSTLRRSLGALLKERLALQAVPRGKGASIQNIRNYNFTPEGEARLSIWMKNHLAYAYFVAEDDISLLEKGLIRAMCPPLNLTGWKNPQRGEIRALRKACADEAWAAQAQAC
ncbi:MAG: hypothetical protein EBV03_02775 [Proteobacteria bacterium]|nr:hypothetical protein [Pseudomonadota bacterium]